MSQNQSETQIFCSTPPLIQFLAEGEIHYFSLLFQRSCEYLRVYSLSLFHNFKR